MVKLLGPYLGAGQVRRARQPMLLSQEPANSKSATEKHNHILLTDTLTIKYCAMQCSVVQCSAVPGPGDGHGLCQRLPVHGEHRQLAERQGGLHGSELLPWDSWTIIFGRKCLISVLKLGRADLQGSEEPCRFCYHSVKGTFEGENISQYRLPVYSRTRDARASGLRSFVCGLHAQVMQAVSSISCSAAVSSLPCSSAVVRESDETTESNFVKIQFDSAVSSLSFTIAIFVVLQTLYLSTRCFGRLRFATETSRSSF
jgi:hypothetical protein